jgi:hypothetical protein
LSGRGGCGGSPAASTASIEANLARQFAHSIAMTSERISIGFG